MSKENILIIDDEDELRGLLARVLALEDYKIWEAPNARKGLDILGKEDIQVAIVDVRLPDASGIDLVPKIKDKYPLIEIIILTAYGTIEDGVRAMKLGAFDYITKGDKDDQIVAVVEKAVEKARMLYRIEQLENKVSEKYSFDNLTGTSAVLKETVNIAKKVAGTDVPVFIVGETGTGKEILAQSIHYASPRKLKPFVAINCSAFARELLESEMFGYKAGAFTGATKNKKGLFEEASGGTLFLDEIGEMNTDLQAKLLRVLEFNTFIKPGDTKPTNVDVRIIAATNRNLEQEIKNGSFRADLYYRISVVKIEMPPLRERKEDIPLLAEFFIKYYSTKLNRNISGIEPEFMQKLLDYDYPGNVRELKNIIERAIILTEGSILKVSSLPKEFSISNHIQKISNEVSSEIFSLEELEKRHIQRVLEFTRGNKTKAAELLGIGSTTLYRKIQSYGLE
ncbi:MAG TPA: sigma-54 dependent transcriptional regulator [Thermodesulfobacteriota bacterium]|nr:sigma-54 dependent transcriptional regulator [Thermodesulfobacteriota bacterium]